MVKGKWRDGWAFLSGGLCWIAAAGQAHAGIDECNNVRLEDVRNCELRGDLECQAGCEEFGVYKKACATRLHTVCREECVLDPEPDCTDECTEQCSADCDLGINVICVHNCFGECSGNCEANCAQQDDPAQCQATCEATCDGECDIKCEPVVDGSCYQHCIECCGGACTAQANMTCQTSCQEEQFEDCEYEFRADCDASCSGDGALFCDGEYILSGRELPECARALVEEGVLEVEFDAQGNIDVSATIDQIEDAADDAEDSSKSSASCAVRGIPSSQSGAVQILAGLFLFAIGLRGAQRRRWPAPPENRRGQGR